MTDLTQALRGAGHAGPSPRLPLQPQRGLLVLGAGGVLGAAVMAEALVPGRFAQVQALARAPLASTVRGFVPVRLEALQPGAVPADAVMVFERERRANGRDDAFVQPQPEQLLALATRLHAAGVRRLVVVVPHAPALLPLALGRGLATLDEAAVAALGFEHLVLLRAAQDGSGAAPTGALPRFAAWWLSQLKWMVPQRQQPLRAVTLARCVVQLVRLLPLAAGGSRVIDPETLWLWGQHDDGLEAAMAGGLGISDRP